MRPEYEAFLQRVGAGGRASLPEVYHGVRNIPYGSTGVRDPGQVIKRNLGSCSGKHILLRDLLRELGYKAEIVTMFTHFNRDLSPHESMPEALRTMMVGGPVFDFHHYVRVKDDSGWLRLDATWHDRLVPYGFRVNDRWSGAGDTVLAAEAIYEYPPEEDVAALKVRLLEELQPPERERRADFFRMLTDWIAKLGRER